MGLLRFVARIFWRVWGRPTIFRQHTEEQDHAQAEPLLPSTPMWAELPQDVLAAVLNCLDSPTVALHCRLVCKAWHIKLDAVAAHLELTACPSPSFLQRFPSVYSVSALRCSVAYGAASHAQQLLRHLVGIQPRLTQLAVRLPLNSSACDLQAIALSPGLLRLELLALPSSSSSPSPTRTALKSRSGVTLQVQQATSAIVAADAIVQAAVDALLGQAAAIPPGLALVQPLDEEREVVDDPTPAHLPRLDLSPLLGLSALKELMVCNITPQYDTLTALTTLTSLTITRRAPPLDPDQTQIRSRAPDSPCQHTVTPEVFDLGSSPASSSDSFTTTTTTTTGSPATRSDSPADHSSPVTGSGVSTPIPGLTLRGVGVMNQLMRLRAPRAQQSWLLPQELFRLTQLQELDVSHNLLVELPEALGQLKNLRCLMLTGCCLEVLPDSLSQLSHLTYLAASFNPNLKLPLSLTSLTNLQRLELAQTDSNVGQVFEESPASFQNPSVAVSTPWGPPAAATQSVEYLDLCANSNIQQLPPSFAELCGSLTTLLLAGNALLQGVPLAISTLTSLTTLDMSFCCLECISDTLPTSLQQLRLAGNKLKRLPKNIGRLKGLKQLDCSANALQDLPPSMTRLVCLHSLDVSLNPMKSLKGLVSLPNLEKVKAISLCGGAASVQAVDHLRLQAVTHAKRGRLQLRVEC